jgi:hypothetical protein
VDGNDNVRISHSAMPSRSIEPLSFGARERRPSSESADGDDGQLMAARRRSHRIAALVEPGSSAP